MPAKTFTLYKHDYKTYHYDSYLGYEFIKKWIEDNKTDRRAFIICVADSNGSLTYAPRTRQPCWGELRTHYKDIRKPNDLHFPFPDGTPVGLGIVYPVSKEFLPFFEWQISKDSPWGSLFTKDVHILKDSHNLPYGLIFTDTNFDPTLLVSFLLNSYTIIPKEWFNLLNDYLLLIPLIQSFTIYSAAIVKYHQHSGYYKDLNQLPLNHQFSDMFSFNSLTGDGYNLAHRFSLKLWINKQPRNLTIDAPTFYERGAYNRKELANIFRDPVTKENTNLATHFKHLQQKDQIFYPISLLTDVIIPETKELFKSLKD